MPHVTDVGGLLQSYFMQVVKNIDVNTLLKPGYFVINGNVTNLPQGAYLYGTMSVFGVYNQRIVQMYFPDYFQADNKLYIRSVNGDDIKPWRSVILT